MSVSCTRTDIPIVPGHRRGSRYIPWSTRKAKGLASHLLSWRRVRGDLDWLASAGHRRGAAFIIGKIIEANDLTAVAKFNSGYEFVECSDLSHIGQLIVEHWDVFQGFFKRATPPYTTADFNAKFDRVRNARNDVYHH